MRFFGHVPQSSDTWRAPEKKPEQKPRLSEEQVRRYLEKQHERRENWRRRAGWSSQ